MEKEEIVNDTLKNETGMKTPETPTEKTEEEKSKELQSALAQKEHFRKKYEDLRAEKEKPESQIGTPKSFDPMETVKISKVLNKYNDEESEFILSRAGSSSFEAIKKAEEDKWTQIAIQGMRDKVAKEQKVPTPSSPSGISGEKTPQDIAKMTKDEHRKFVDEMEKKMRMKSEGGGI
jgi:hypothetical protein